MPRNDQLELALDLYRAGVDLDSHVLIDIANNLMTMGYSKLTAVPISQWSMEVEEVVAENGDVELPPDPNLTKRFAPSSLAREMVVTSSRKISAGGVQWGSDYVDPNNITPPKDTLEKAWSGWALNYNQTEIMKMFAGEKGRFTVGIQSVLNFIKKRGRVKPGQDPSARKHIKPHYVMNSLARRGLVMEIDRDVWILSPRGAVFVRDYLGLEPTRRHDSVDIVEEPPPVEV